MHKANVRASALTGWGIAMAGQGVDPNAAALAAGIDPMMFDNDSGTLPLRAFAKMSEFAGDQSLNPAFSWMMGEHHNLCSLGVVGEAVLSAQTLGVALRRLADHFLLVQDSTELRLDVDADCAEISYRILDPDIWPRHHDAMFSLGIVSQIIKAAIPDAFHNLHIMLESGQRPVGLSLGQSQITFNGETNALRFPARCLHAAMPVARAACDMRALSDELVTKRRTFSTRKRLEDMIFGHLFEGTINQDRLAKEVGMSSRTMRRRLSEDGLSFQHLLDECRMRQAVLEFSIGPAKSIAEIALKLGYSEHSTFTRAFTRWAKMPPVAYRSQLTKTLH